MFYVKCITRYKHIADENVTTDMYIGTLYYNMSIIDVEKHKYTLSCQTMKYCVAI